MADQSTISLARDNLRKGMSSPVAKVAVAGIALLVVILTSVAVVMSRGGGPRSQKAGGSNFEVSADAPRGAVDPEMAKAVGQAADQQAAAAQAKGQSFAGPFVYEQERGLGGPGGQSQAAADRAPAVIAALKRKAQEYDVQDDAASRSSPPPTQTGGAQPQENYAGGGARNNSQSQGNSQNPYGLTPEAFQQIARQLETVGTQQMRYEGLANGLLARSATAATAPAAPATGVASPNTQLAQQPAAGPPNAAAASSAATSAREIVIARGGTMCPAIPDSSINTDFNVPVFVELLDCGELSGARLRGTIAKSPDNFTINFTSLFLPANKRYKTAGAIEAMAVNIAKDGVPGVADDVNNHWITRLGSSALLALARTERQFIAARGSTTVNTGSSSSTSVDPLTSDQKRDARLAGLMEGTVEVVSKDLSTGVNRAATMTTNKTTVLGVKFTNDVKVVPLD